MTTDNQTPAPVLNSAPALKAAWLAVAVYAVAVLVFFGHRKWDPDEFEHVQSAWMISLGMMPYVDYFEHHTPLWDILASLVFRVRSPDSAGTAITLIIVLRAASVACSAATALLTWRLARRAGGPATGLLALALLVSDTAFLAKGMEVRPDPLALMLVLAGVTAGLIGLDAEREGRRVRSAVAFAAAGAALCLATLATQKVLFVLPGFAAACVHVLILRRHTRRIVPCAAWTVAAGLVCTVPVLAWFGTRHGLAAFFHYNFFLNAGWVRSPFVLHYFTLGFDGIFDLMGLAGFALAVWSLVMGRARPEVAMCAWIMASVIAGGFAIPVVMAQYIMFVVPFAATLAALAILKVFAAIPAGRLRMAVGCLAAVLLIANAGRNARQMMYLRDTQGVATLEYVMKTVPTDQTVMGGWTPGIAFREPAWFYYFPHGEIQAAIPKADFRALAAGLENGRIRPVLVDYDGEMHLMPADVRAAIEDRYRPTGMANLWERKPDQRSVSTPVSTRSSLTGEM